MKRSLCFAIVGFVVVVALSVTAGAKSITIDNPGFEDPVLADGEDDWSMDNQGWGYFDVSNDGYLGSWNPGLPGTTYPGYGGNAPEGQNVGWTNPGGVGVPGGFAQVLTDADATLTVDTTYTLTVEVGNTLGWPWGGYKVQLLAGGTPHTPGTGGDYTGLVTGGTLLAEDNNRLTIAEDTFETSTVTYTYDPELHSGLLGEPLQIRLLSLGNVVADDETEADFDNVRLTKDTASGAAACLVVDDMEEDYIVYAPGVPGLHVYDVWVDGSGNCDAIPGNGTGSFVSLAGAGTSPAGPAYGVYSMKLAYDNDGTVTDGCPPNEEVPRSAYSMVKAQIAGLPSGINSNWLAGGIRSLSLQFYGDAGNDIEPMWVELGDSIIDGNSAKVTYGDNPGENANDIKEPSWHEWDIDLQDFVDNNSVNLADVKTIAIGIGDPGDDPNGSGTVYFDDIRVCIRRCILASRDADFATVDYVGDCVVDYKEVDMMAENWLDTGGGGEFVPEYEITIPNAGFEDRALGDGSVVWWRTNQNTGWYYADQDGSLGGSAYNQGVGMYQWNPGLDATPGNWTSNGFGGIAPEGNNIIAVTHDEAGAAQLLTETFDHTKAYQLTAQVAGLEDSYWGASWLGYGLEILVGGTIEGPTNPGYKTIEGGTRIAYVEKTEEECGFEDETFYTVTLTYVPDVADAPLDGQPLQIRVMCHPDNGYAFFDDVKLFRGSGSGSGSRPEPDLYEDMIINFKDFAVLADRFLDEDGMFPEL